MREIGNDLLRLGMDLTCCSEKLVNMNLLMMHVAAKESDFEAFTLEKENKVDSSAVAALEFDILSGFFDLEVKEMNNFIGKLKIKFKNSCDAISSYKHLEKGFLKFEEKLLDAEKSLKQSEEQVQELMTQSAKFQRIVLRANRGETSDEDRDVGVEENGEFFNSTTKFQMQTPEQQRHILRLLEKSMARELDLENQLTESMQTIDKMNRKLYYSQRELSSVEDETAAVYARFLEADNASAVLMGISKELIGQLQSCQLNINSALCRESDLSTKLQNCMETIQKLEKEEAISQELAEKNSLEAMVLKEKVNSLEEQLKTSELTLLNGSLPLNHGNMQDEVKALEEKVVDAESRAQKAEAESKLLSITNKELIEKMDQRTAVSCEKIDLLEKQLRERDLELQQAMVSEEASQEKNSLEAMVLKEKLNSLEEQLKTSESALLNGSAASAPGNMQHEVKVLEEKVVTAESRAEKAEAESNLISITNKELIEEMDQRSAVSCEKIDSLEEQLREKDFQLQQAMVSIEASQEKQSMYCTSIEDMEIVIEKLKTNLSAAESRAEIAESECVLLAKANKELNKELDIVKADSIISEKFVLLENKLREADIQLQQASASVEASHEKQTMLISSINDRETLIEKLKSKVLKADARADSAEDKCIILSERHAEQNEELNFLRGKVGSFEASLQQTEEKKLAAAKDITTRTKVITDLVVQLALERERLQKQISWLMEDNRACKDKLKMANKLSRGSMIHDTRETEDGVLSSDNHVRTFHAGIVDSNISGTAEVHKSAEDVLDGESSSELEASKAKLDTVRTIDAGRLTLRHILSAILIAFAAVLATCFLSPENCPF
ncbi:hypothetical protein KSS87_022913 [Heliosperma pusillum]|nr:hypothetical protein KSS87_022913 [Heliosperma pusillum]